MTERRASFRRFAIATIAAVYFLIFVGGLVRASGSGMGCPDWPKCFGRWVPPTSESQLPADYQERWAEHGYGAARFNVWRTWTEYGNRMIGVVIGFLILATLLLSLRFRREDPALVWWCAAALVLVGFNGWLGSVVVSTNLEPWIITAHMLAALAVVAALLLALEREARHELAALDVTATRATAWLFGAALALSLLQLVMGTQVREEVDHLVNAAVVTDRADWAGELGSLVLVHRSFSLAVLVVNLWLARRLAREAARAPLLRRAGGVDRRGHRRRDRGRRRALLSRLPAGAAARPPAARERPARARVPGGHRLAPRLARSLDAARDSRRRWRRLAAP